jgi:GTP-binding protein Era
MNDKKQRSKKTGITIIDTNLSEKDAKGNEKEEREEKRKQGIKKSFRSGFVAVVGLPNAGKSTIVNRFLREKISIVSPKPQTTRSNVTCILSGDDYQVIFVDTPGILKPRYRMQEVMASYIAAAVKESDLLLLIIDASRYAGELPPPLVGFSENVKRKKMVLALNKIDLVPQKEKLLELMQKSSELFPEAEIVPISAREGEGMDELFRVILGYLPEGPRYFPEDMISNESERFFASELIREAIFLTMEEEIPYSTAVIVEGFEEKPAGAVITASILAEKDSQKPILIGKKGAAIKEIGTKARLAIEEFLGVKVYLDLHVKVRKDWRKKDAFLREIGLLRK